MWLHLVVYIGVSTVLCHVMYTGITTVLCHVVYTGISTALLCCVYWHQYSIVSYYVL